TTTSASARSSTPETAGTVAWGPLPAIAENPEVDPSSSFTSTVFVAITMSGGSYIDTRNPAAPNGRWASLQKARVALQSLRRRTHLLKRPTLGLSGMSLASPPTRAPVQAATGSSPEALHSR